MTLPLPDRKALSRRALLGTFSALAAAPALACQRREQAGGQPSQAAQAPATIRMLERAGTEEQALDIRVPQFMEKYSWIKVEREVVTGDIIQAQFTMAAADTMPDTAHAYLGDQSYHAFAANGVYVSIEDLVARDKLDLNGWFPALIDAMRIEGKLHGLPFKGQVLTCGLYYNKDLFDAAGLKYPNEDWTLDDLMEAANKLTKREGGETVQWGYGLQTWGGENWCGHMRNWDAEWLTQDGKRSLLNTPQIQTGLQWYYDMWHKWRTLAPPSLNPAGALFPQSRCAMLGRCYANYKSSVLLPNNVRFNWSMTIMPKGPTGNRGGMFAGDAQAVTKNSKRRDAAYELVKWLCDKETGVQLGLQTKGSTTLGGRPDVYADPRILNHPQYPRDAQEAQLKSIQVMKGHFSVPWNFRALEVYRVRDPYLNRVVQGEAQPDTGFLENLHREVQAILDQPRP